MKYLVLLSALFFAILTLLYRSTSFFNIKCYWVQILMLPQVAHDSRFILAPFSTFFHLLFNPSFKKPCVPLAFLLEFDLE